MACEEAGKLPILIGTATEVVLGIPVDWKTTHKRFRSHESKASQFLGLARAIPMIRSAAAAGQKTIDAEEMMIKAAVGVVIGPALFSKRNASIYCDFEGNSFTSPVDQIDSGMTDQMIEFAEQNVAAANLILGSSAQEAAQKLKNRASRERYDAIMSRASEAADLAQTAMSMIRKQT
jgi:AbiV family abortive infection protein